MERYKSFFSEEELEERFVAGSLPTDIDKSKFVFKKGYGRSPDNPKKFVKGYIITKKKNTKSGHKTISKAQAKMRAKKAARTKARDPKAKKLAIKRAIQTRKKNKN